MLRLGLPYGVVMATGGAAQLAVTYGLGSAARSLLWLAVAEAGWIAGRGLLRRRNELHLPWSTWARIGPPAELTGVLTVPLGLAVVATGLATQPGPAKVLGASFVALAWLCTAAFLARLAISVARKGGTTALDGGWFLAPAAVLGSGIAAGAYTADTAGALAHLLGWVALAAAAVGTAGYWAVVLGSAITFARRGLGDSRRVLWWIAAGCGGLAATAIARGLSSGGPWSAGEKTFAHSAAIITWSFAALLAVPIVAISVHFIVHCRRIGRAAPWPPTFSTAVFALGALGTGKMLEIPAVTVVGKVAAAVTLALWTVTAALHASRLLQSTGRQLANPTDRRDDPTVLTGLPHEQAPPAG